MLVYIVEDDEDKAEQITLLLGQHEHQVSIERYRSYQSGLKAVLSIPPALLILDMSLPTFDFNPTVRTGRPRNVGGYDLLRKMKLHGILAPAVIVTQLESFDDGETTVTLPEIEARCRSECPQHFMGSVFYSPTSDNWRRELSLLLTPLLGSLK